jgi:putative transposase
MLTSPIQTFARILKEPFMPDVAGQYYHVYNRGCNRENIFSNDGNYRYLLQQAKKFLIGSGIGVVTYCLMPNHYHFLLRSDSDGSIARFIQRLFNSYAQAFNKQQDRSGTLFEGRAKSIWVDDEKYLLQLCRYIHLNPVVAGLVSRAEDWQYSNYLDWIGERDGTLIDREFIRTYFAKPSEYVTFIETSIEAAIAAKLEKYYAEDD